MKAEEIEKVEEIIDQTEENKNETKESEVTKQEKVTNKRKIPIWKKIIITLVILITLGITTVLILFYGPISTFRDWWITTAMTTMSHQYLAEWFFDKETIKNAKKYCDEIAEKTDEIQKNIIIAIKEELMKRGLYSFEQYKSIDVYKAVVEENVKNVEEFLQLFQGL